MTLCTLHSHSFVYGWSIVIKFNYLTDIYFAINWWKIQQNMPGRFLEIPIFLGDYFLCRTLYSLRKHAFIAAICVCMSSQINTVHVTDSLLSNVIVRLLVSSLFDRFFGNPSPQLCHYTATTSQILADNWYENSAMNYNERKLFWISCCCQVKVQEPKLMSFTHNCGRLLGAHTTWAPGPK